MAKVYKLRIDQREKRRIKYLNSLGEDYMNKIMHQLQIYIRMSPENIAVEAWLPGSFGFPEIEDFFRVRSFFSRTPDCWKSL